MLRIVHTGCGAIEGIAAPEPEITVFRGIPFAAPPVGDLRWRAPQPVAAWAGTLAAHDFAPACPQPTPGDSNGPDADGTPLPEWTRYAPFGGDAMRLGQRTRMIRDWSTNVERNALLQWGGAAAD